MRLSTCCEEIIMITVILNFLMILLQNQELAKIHPQLSCLTAELGKKKVFCQNHILQL